MEDFSFPTRPSDIDTLSNWILSQKAPLDTGITRIVYKLLNLLKFQSNDANEVQKLVHICFDTLIYVFDQTSSLPSESSELHHQAVLLMRICSNFVAMDSSFGNYIIENWFVKSQNRSLALFFNHFIALFVANSISINEIYWFIGNLMKCQHNEQTLKYFESDEFFVKIDMK